MTLPVMNPFNYNSQRCNQTIYTLAYNLTSSYTDQSNEAPMVTTSVIMFLLAALFFNLNLFSRFSDVSAILNPTVRLFLSTALTLFLPVMSYLFSEAKNEGAAAAASGSGSGSGEQQDELSLRARTILMWMLLVELLRKKVEAILLNAGMQGYSGTIERAARIAWLGYLVFFNLRSTGKKAIYGLLWVLAAAKLVQRVVINEVLKRSFAYGRNAELIHSYMARVPPPENSPADGSALLKRCNYAVMGEEELEKKAGPNGYLLPNADSDSSAVITVGKIWRLAHGAHPEKEEADQLLKKDPLKRLCLSFALYKLLRQRFEDLPVADDETRSCRELIFNGLCKEKEEEHDGSGIALFEVLDEELHFLCEYYHSVLPVVLANPFFFLLNYILFPIVVWALFILTFILCANGDLPYAYHSIATDNYVLSNGIMEVAACLITRIARSPQVLFSIVDLGVTLLLLLTFIYEEVWEFIVFILSNWLMVSLLCHYAAEPRWRESRVLVGIVRRILWVRSKLSRPNLCFHQLSVPGPYLCRLLQFTVPTKTVPKDVKQSIVKYLLDHIHSGGDRLSNGWSTLQSEKHRRYQDLSWACKSESVAEVILAWHIATTLLEKQTPPSPAAPAAGHVRDHRKVATTLSRYCAYLVAFSPELLPDDKDGTERAYKDMEKELKEGVECWRYYLLECSELIMELAGRQKPAAAAEEAAAWKGVRLGKILVDEAKESGAGERVWELLADVWTELMVFVAPSSGEVHFKAHKEALVHGGEFVTVLWALAKHTGITRPAVAAWKRQTESAELQPRRLGTPARAPGPPVGGRGGEPSRLGFSQIDKV